MIYQWTPGAHLSKIDPQKTGERLEQLRLANSGVTATIVVDDARPDDSLLHPAFEWRDAVAAEEYRKAQARDILRHIVAVPDAEPDRTPIRAFVVINQLGEDSYTSLYVAMADESMRQQILARALRELRQFQAKYRELSELAEVLAAVERVTSEAA